MERRISGYGKDLEGFTPVRRRPSTVNTRQLHTDSEKEWTAARCNRLLRALKSRVAILNKDLLWIQLNNQGRDATTEGKAGTIRKADQDPDWTQGRKRVKRTYSARGGKSNLGTRNSSQVILRAPAWKESRSFIPLEILAPTPILNRARGDIVNTSSSAPPPVEIGRQDHRPNKRTKPKDSQSTFQLSETLRDFRKQIPASRYTVYEGIYNGLETLLKATVAEEPPKRRSGSKSLLALCLETVPRYIAEEEELFAAHTEETGSKSALDSRDISTEIYDDLEYFGSIGKGWRHLRVIVRSHGIQVISDAIRAGSLDGEFVGILITLCIHTKAIKEAETLLSSLLSSTVIPGPKSVFTRFADEPPARSLSMLWKFVEMTGTSSFQFRQLSDMVSGGLVPVSWLATRELASVWTSAIQALSLGWDDTDALIFMDTVLPLLAQSRWLTSTEGFGTEGSVMLDATRHTFSSLLTTLSSIVILSRDTAKQTQSHIKSPAATEYGHLVALIRSCLVQWELSSTSSIEGTLLVVANLFTQEVGHNTLAEVNLVDVDALLNHLCKMGRSSTILPSHHEVVTFICSVARCCGRGASSSGFEHLEKLHQILEELVLDQESEGGNILREIISDSALAFAQEVPDRKHLDYAAKMEGKVHRIETKPNQSHTPRHSLNSSHIGYRWEDGISEWVSATPGISAGKFAQSTTFSRADQSSHETPFHRPVRRRLDKKGLLHTRAGMLRSESGASTYRDDSILTSPAIVSSASEIDEVSEEDTGSIISLEADAVGHYASEDDLVDGTSPGIVSPNTIDSSGEELASDSAEEDEPNNEDSMDELQPSSPQSNSSDDSEPSQAPSPQREDSLADTSFTSVTSSAISYQGTEPRNRRRYIDRVPRLSRRVLRRSLQWQLFDDSDDELSFITSVSSESDSVLQDITNKVANSTSTSTRRPFRTTKPATKAKSVGRVGMDNSLLGESEDELCV